MDKEDVYIYSMEHYLATKKNETMPLAETWLDLEMTDTKNLSEVSQKDKYHIISLICGI